MIVETAGVETRLDSSARRSAISWRVAIALFVVAVACFVYGVRSETTKPDFGLLTVSFLYFMGVSQAGVVLTAITRLVRAEWAKPYYRLAELSTLAFFPFAIGVFLLLFVYARHELFHWLAHDAKEHASPWLNERWLVIRNLFGLLLFYGVSAVYVFKSLGPRTGRRAAQDVQRQLYLMSPWVIAAFVICNTLIAWDFGMMLAPHWHSTVFPIYFWFGNLFAGAAALIVFPAVVGRTADARPRFGRNEIRSLGMLLTTFTLLWLYFFWAQFFVIWFGNLPYEFGPLWRQMHGHYAPWFWTMMIACFFLPFAAFIFAAVKRSLSALCFIALSINIGIWINKYLTVIPVLVADHRPFQHWLDIVLALGLLAGFIAAVILLGSRWPDEAREQKTRAGVS